MRQFIKLTW